MKPRSVRRQMGVFWSSPVPVYANRLLLPRARRRTGHPQSEEHACERAVCLGGGPAGLSASNRRLRNRCAFGPLSWNEQHRLPGPGQYVPKSRLADIPTVRMPAPERTVFRLKALICRENKTARSPPAAPPSPPPPPPIEPRPLSGAAFRNPTRLPPSLRATAITFPPPAAEIIAPGAHETPRVARRPGLTVPRPFMTNRPSLQTLSSVAPTASCPR